MRILYIGAAAAVLLLFTACEEKKESSSVTKPEVIEEKESTKDSSTAEEIAPGEELYGVPASVAMNKDAVANPHSQNPGVKRAKSLEVLDAGVYTYIKVDDGSGVYWIAGPKSDVAVGEEISFAPQMWMENFPSKSLNKTFEKILFVAVIAPLNANGSNNQQPHNCGNCDKDVPAQEDAANSTTNTVDNIQKPIDGYSIAEIYKKSDELKDKSIKVNGKVTKVVKAVMGKDWVHISDGTGSEGTNDLVITSTSADVKEGDVVTVIGTLKKDVDFGYGYFYPVIVEEATFKLAEQVPSS